MGLFDTLHLRNRVTRLERELEVERRSHASTKQLLDAERTANASLRSQVSCLRDGNSTPTPRDLRVSTDALTSKKDH